MSQGSLWCQESVVWVPKANVLHCSLLAVKTLSGDTSRPAFNACNGLRGQVDKELQMPVDGTCSLLALEAFNRYEIFWSGKASDNCRVDTVTRTVPAGAAANSWRIQLENPYFRRMRYWRMLIAFRFLKKEV